MRGRQTYPQIEWLRSVGDLNRWGLWKAGTYSSNIAGRMANTIDCRLWRRNLSTEEWPLLLLAADLPHRRRKSPLPRYRSFSQAASMLKNGVLSQASVDREATSQASTFWSMS